MTRLSVLVALLAALGIWLLYLLFDTSSGPSVRPGSGLRDGWLSNLIGLLVVVLALAAVAVAGRDLANRRRARRVRDQPEVGTLTIAGSARAGLVRFDLQGGGSWGGAEPGFGPYRRQRDHALPPLPPSVALQVAPELAALPWEAVVLPATRPPRGDEQRACWRGLPPLAPSPPAGRPNWRTARPSRWSRQHGPCGVLAPRSWLPLLTESLGQVRIIGRSEVDPLDALLGTLVLMGTPVETSAGIRLRLEEERTDLLLVEPDNARWYDHRLVVVLGEPGEGAVRLDAEREATADLRRCAAELAAAGAESVLCLPSMPGELAGQVLRELDRRLRGVERGGWRELVSATEAIRRRIEGSVPGLPAASPEAERARELALEVTVFVRPGRTT